MTSFLSINGTAKTYESGVQALKPIHLDIAKGEIFALLGPNGAGKTTLISIICGLVNPSAGVISIDGQDTRKNWRAARQRIGLVPQELNTDSFETVWDTVKFSRGLFGLAPNAAYLEAILKDLTLWDKKDAKINTLSGGMKRRVMIAKALSHEPQILFLDEPTAGVDVELRKDMWATVRRLKHAGVTIILTTHYIEEAEDMADRVGVIAKGELLLVDEKTALMTKLGQRQLILELNNPLTDLPAGLSDLDLRLDAQGQQLIYSFKANSDSVPIATVIQRLNNAGVAFHDLRTQESSLEEIFVALVRQAA